MARPESLSGGAAAPLLAWPAQEGTNDRMRLMRRCRCHLTGIAAGIRHILRGGLWARPVAATHAAGTASDLLRGRAQLLVENALLRQQLLVLRRSVARPAVMPADRALLVLLAGRVRAWRQALHLVQ